MTGASAAPARSDSGCNNAHAAALPPARPYTLTLDQKTPTQRNRRRGAPEVGLFGDMQGHRGPLVLERGVRVAQRAQHGQELGVGGATPRERRQALQLHPVHLPRRQQRCTSGCG